MIPKVDILHDALLILFIAVANAYSHCLGQHCFRDLSMFDASKSINYDSKIQFILFKYNNILSFQTNETKPNFTMKNQK